LAIGILSGFFLRRPLKILGGGADPRRSLAWKCLAVLGALTTGGVIFAAILAPPPRLWPLLLMAPPGFAFAWFDSRGEARAALAEVSGAFAFSIVPAAMATMAGWGPEAALASAAVMAGRSVPTVLTIRAHLRRRKGQPAAIFTAFTAALIALGIVAVLGNARLAPSVAVWFMAMLLVHAAALLGPFRFRIAATQLGIAEAIMGGTGVIFVAVSWSH
jgi:hypothetical protein